MIQDVMNLDKVTKRKLCITYLSDNSLKLKVKNKQLEFYASSDGYMSISVDNSINNSISLDKEQFDVVMAWLNYRKEPKP